MKEKERTEINPIQAPGEEKIDSTLRPKNLDEFVGQENIRRNLKIFIEAARMRKEPLDHCLFYGPPGLGKTTLAYIIAHESGVNLRATSGPILERVGDLAAILTSLQEGDVFFIDEIHRLNHIVEEALYPVMEEFALDVIIGQGPSAKTLKIPLPKFTLVGATTRAGLLTSPLRERFGISEHLNFYTMEELKKIVLRSSSILNINIKDEPAAEIARRSRGTPRIVNRLLRRVRDFADVQNKGIFDIKIVKDSMEQLGVDPNGLDSVDRKILNTIIEKFAGGPVGVETIAVAISEEVDTVTDVYEPYLIQSGFLARTPRGRIVTSNAYDALGIPKPKDEDGTRLF